MSTPIIMTTQQEELVRTLLTTWVELKTSECVSNRDLSEMVASIPLFEEDGIQGLFPEPTDEGYAVEHLLRMLDVPEVE